MKNLPLDLSAPLNVNLEVTGACNLSCIYCSAGAEHFSRQGELTIHQLFDLADQLQEMKILRVKITGGEPFYKKGIFDFLRKLSKNHRIVINTNCTLISEETVKKLYKLNLDSLIVSLDSPDPEINDMIRGKGSFKRVISGLKLLYKGNINISILATLSRYNYNNFFGLTKIAAQFGLGGVNLNNVNILGRAGKIFKSISLTTREKERIAKLIRDHNSKNKIKINWAQAHWYELPERAKKMQNEDVGRINNLLPCHAGVDQCGITYTGDVVPCIYFTKFVAGNIKKNSLKEIWDKSDVFKTMKVVAQTQTDRVNKCKGCKYLPICAGGCRAKAMEHNGGLYEIDPECHYCSN